MQKKQATYSSKKELLIIVSICILLIEILIFSVAFSMSNYHPRICIIDNNNNIIHESQARTFSIFSVYLFEKKYGSLDNYRIDIEKKNVQFPFRAWLCAAFCVPICIVFMIAMFHKAIHPIKNISLRLFLAKMP